MESELTNKIYAVTGATSGIGLAAAEILVGRGASVIGVGRSAERCRAAELHLKQLNPAVQVAYLAADLSVQAEVRALAEGIRQALTGWGRNSLDGLLNNAGTFAYWLTLTPDGVELQWAVNHLAPFLLTSMLEDLLQAAQGRVVTVSSGSHYGARLNWADPQLRRGYNGLSAYGNTKLANVLFTQELRRRGLRAFAADPGLVKTDIGLKGTPSLAGWVWKLRRSGGIPAEESARGIVYLLTEPTLQERLEIYWKHGRPQPASRAAQDEQSARRLWQLSQQMCGLPMGV